MRIREYSRQNGFSWPPHYLQSSAWLTLGIIFIFTIFLTWSRYDIPKLGRIIMVVIEIFIFSAVFVLKIITTCTDALDESVLNGPNGPMSANEYYATPRANFIKGITGDHVIVEKSLARGRIPSNSVAPADLTDENGSGYYCHVCLAMISNANTKHCRQCNKCIMDWDHHCTWLNTCIGRSNYTPFLWFIKVTFAASVIFEIYFIVLVIIISINPLSPSPTADVHIANTTLQLFFNSSSSTELPAKPLSDTTSSSTVSVSSTTTMSSLVIATTNLSSGKSSLVTKTSLNLDNSPAAENLSSEELPYLHLVVALIAVIINGGAVGGVGRLVYLYSTIDSDRATDDSGEETGDQTKSERNSASQRGSTSSKSIQSTKSTKKRGDKCYAGS